jgi:hypothetical protein
MRNKTECHKSRIATVILLGIIFLYLGAWQAQAQEGYNAIICTGLSCPSSTIPSSAFIDASVFGSSGDVCAQIRLAIGQLPTSGTTVLPGVIDARGVTPALTSSTVNEFKCTDTPWYNSATTSTTPTVILLPAGVINMNYTWVIPTQTRVFGAGVYGAGPRNTNHYDNGYGTSLVCYNNLVTCKITAGNPMIQFGGEDASNNIVCYQCTGSSVEYLTLDGVEITTEGETISSYPQSFVGILNLYCQDGCYVNQVNFINLAGTGAVGLQVGPPNSNGSAINSGPYTDLFFIGRLLENDTDPQAVNEDTKCVEIAQSGTMGVHGITCVEGDHMYGATAAIYLDASNTTIEDAHIEDFNDGVRVGASQSAQADTLANISAYGVHEEQTGVQNTIHICALPTCGADITVSDLTIAGIAAVGGGTPPVAVKDDQTSVSTGQNVGLYALGTSGATFAGGRTRFFAGATVSSSTNQIPSWSVGDTSAPGTTCQVGSIYSNVGGVSGSTFYVCHSTTGGGAWTNIK